MKKDQACYSGKFYAPVYPEDLGESGRYLLQKLLKDYRQKWGLPVYDLQEIVCAEEKTKPPISNKPPINFFIFRKFFVVN
mgnify:CR=1 FL=1